MIIRWNDQLAHVLRGTVICCLLGLSVPGCACPRLGGNSAALPSEERTKESQALAFEIAETASELANDECERVFGARPFNATSYVPAEQADGSWVWGRREIPGIRGYSAIVRVGIDRAKPSVEVFWTGDYDEEAIE